MVKLSRKLQFRAPNHKSTMLIRRQVRTKIILRYTPTKLGLYLNRYLEIFNTLYYRFNIVILGIINLIYAKIITIKFTIVD